MAKLWGGRFSKKTNELVEEFTNSIHYDHALAKYDCLGSLHHINVLKKAKLLTASEHTKLSKGLKQILSSAENKTLKIDASFEDIHSYIQHVLEQKVGKTALKLHTCRSRNDQVVFDVKYYSLDQIVNTIKLLVALKDVLKNVGAKNEQIVLPGFTHLQHAIPVSLKNQFDAYGEMLHRDIKRLGTAFENIELTLGSGALAGTFIPASNYTQPLMTDIKSVKAKINAPVNSLDTVSDRDFVIDILSALSLVSLHLSRLAEDMILWSSKEFDFIDIDDAFCTGSSLMPQKKNPDVLELVRGYTGRLYGNLINVLVMMKGLPLSYNRDMQLDKEPLFDSFKIIQSELKVLTELFKNVSFKAANIKKQLADESLYATDLADHLVQKGVAFKDAHGIIGKLIRYKLDSGKNIIAMNAEELKKFHPALTPAIVKKTINAQTSVNSKKSTRSR